MVNIERRDALKNHACALAVDPLSHAQMGVVAVHRRKKSFLGCQATTAADFPACCTEQRIIRVRLRLKGPNGTDLMLNVGRVRSLVNSGRMFSYCL